MATITGYRAGSASRLLFSGTVDAARDQRHIETREVNFIRALTPEYLGVAAQAWEPITHIQIFEAAA